MFRLLLLVLTPAVVRACCTGAPPDPTFIDSDEYFVDSISPNRGTRAGGSRVTIKGGGFNVNFFTAGNYVYIGDSSEDTWAQCDVIEGACSVQCGGPNTIICDTGEWTDGSERSNSGWLDVKVMVEVFIPEAGANSVVELLLENAYYYYHIAYQYLPMLQSVSPHAASSEETLTLKGSNLGYWIQDYRLVYVGTGRAPQGGNVQNGQTDAEKLTTHALCRPGDLNSVQNPREGDLDPVAQAAVMQEDRDPEPIAEDKFLCALGDFMAGSYNVSVYMSNDQRGSSSSLYIAGLAVVYDFEGFYEPALFSKDARGVMHMVQYYPRIDSVTPAFGSLVGGTVVTIEGGGFPMDDEDATVMIDGKACVVTYSSLEKIVCNTTIRGNATVASKVELPRPATASVDSAWMEAVHVVGNWTEVSATTAEGGSYLKFTAGADGDAGSAWVTFAPAAGSSVANSSAVYEALLRLPAGDSECWPRAANVSVVVRSGNGYSLSAVDMSVVSQFSTSSGLDPLETDDADLTELSNSGGGFVSLGQVTLVAGATSLITIDTSGTAGACVSVDNIRLSYVSALTSGCTDPEAANYDSSMSSDDGSCLYVGGRGVTTASWSAMAGPYKLDDWYPTEEYETWGTGDACQIPDGAAASDLETCWHDDCFLHRQCATGSFCCLTDSYEGCNPSYDDVVSVDDEGWKLVFRHDKAVAGGWPKGEWSFPYNATGDPEMSMFSELTELEQYRRPADGRFEFKMCWPDSGFSECQHWMQLKNPMLNPTSVNTHAMCVDCPYTPDTDIDGDGVFRGLQYDGTDHLLDGDSDSYWMMLGAEYVDTDGFYGPQSTNDAGETEYPSVVELYVRPDISGEACLDCKACYDEDGAVRMATFSPTGSMPYTAPACPSFCLTPEHVSPTPREATLKATHQLVVSSKGLSERPCEVIVTYDAIEDENVNTTVCEGVETKKTDAMPSAPEFGRVGGLHSKAFFVAPITANYTFNTRFDDGGELWVSPNADPRFAERVIAVDSVDETSSGAGHDAAASTFCDTWECGDRACFKSYYGFMTYDNAALTCESVGGSLGAPRSSEESTLIRSAMTGGTDYWIGLDDRGQEGTYTYSDGTVAGTASVGVTSGWSYSLFSSSEPNDHSNTENCIEMTSNGYWNDNQCTTDNPFVCEIPADRCSDGARSTETFPMEAGEVRYVEMLGYNNAEEALSLLTLTVDPRDKATYGEAWTTSDVVALSSEFFREIRTDAPAVEVMVSGITAACGAEDGACSFEYSLEHTPLVESIQPATSVPGVTEITITGTGFSAHEQLNDVTIGVSPCVVTSSNTTFILCVISLEDGTAGIFQPSVKVYNKGWALVPQDLTHTILMTINSVFPTSGSLYGGVTLTLTGSGFASFGLHNQVKLLLLNDTKGAEDAVPEGTHDIYDDDWLWQRGYTNSSSARYSEVLCVPRTMKNRPCRYTDEDSGTACDEWVRWAYEDIRVREKAEWFDFSTNTYIECVVESLATPLPAGSVAAINVTVVNTSVLLDSEALTNELAAAKLNFNCAELSHCTTKDSDGIDIGWFGDHYRYIGATGTASNRFTFLGSKTPVVTSISPERAMQGQLIEIHGYGFNTDVPVTDTNWYMSEFGFYYQPYSASITVGTFECQLAYHNDTLIKCNAVYGEMYTPHDVRVAVHGVGNARCTAQFTFAVDIYSITPFAGSVAGGTTITIETSTLNTEAGGLGITSFGVWFIEDLELGLSSYIAEYLGISMGVVCKPIASLTTSTSLTCVTSAVSDGATSSAPSQDTELRSWLIAEWNYNEVYSKCFGNCSFTFQASMTPVLTFDANASTLVVPFAQQDVFSSASDGHTIVAGGDELYLSAEVDISDTNAFNWTKVEKEDISVSLNNVSVHRFDLNVSSVDVSLILVELIVTIPANVPPVLGVSLQVQVEPFGLAVVLGGTVSVLPVITSVSHDQGSNAGGLDVTLFGSNFALADSENGDDDGAWSVTVGGRPCTDVKANASNLVCTTSAFDDDGNAPQGYGEVTVTYSGATEESVCMDPDKYTIERISVNATTNTTNVTKMENRSVFVRDGCLFQFSANTTHTPSVHTLSASHGHWPETVIISGEGFAVEGNEVTLGQRTATVVSENATEIVFTVPKHVGGTYAMSVKSLDKGYATGSQLWFRFDSGISQLSPKQGSRYAGQLLTITGFGFAPFAANLTGSGYASELQAEVLADEEASEYAESFASWVNFGTANESSPFGLDVVFASFDTIIATTNLRTYRALEGEASEAGWLRSLSINVAQADVGFVGPAAYSYVVCSDGDSNCKNLFDEDPTTVYDGHGGGINLNILYAADSPFLLTDYQIVWSTNEVPSQWVLYGRETASSSWEVVDTMPGPRTEPANYKHLNRTVDNPGYYQYYFWIFLEWAPRMDEYSNGHRMRDINLNPNGFAMHYGLAPEKTQEICYEVGIGLTNVAYGRRAYMSSLYGSDGTYDAAHATDGDFSGFQRFNSGTCALSSTSASLHQYLVVDLGKHTQIEKVLIHTSQDSEWWRDRLGTDGGTVVGVSDGWDVQYGDPFGKHNHKSWAPDDHRGHYVWDDIASKDCWAEQNCDVSPNITKCGTVTTQGIYSGQHMVNCPSDTVGRYLFLYQVAVSNYLAVCEVSAYGYVLGNVTNNTVDTPHPTGQPSLPPSPLPTSLPSLLPTASPTYLPSQLPTTLPSAIPSSLPSEIPSQLPTSPPTLLPTASPTILSSQSPTSLPSPIPSSLPSELPSQLPSSTPSGQPTPHPAASPSQLPSSLPTSVPSSLPSALPSELPSLLPTLIDSEIPSMLPAPLPTSMPTPPPVVLSTLEPTSRPSFTVYPTPLPSTVPSILPSASPSSLPSVLPSALPSALPSMAPTVRPTTAVPSPLPTSLPSELPSSMPSALPTVLPLPVPSQVPSSLPSSVPSILPVPLPSQSPSSLPSSVPSALPLPVPSQRPTSLPSSVPSVLPMPLPTLSPSLLPSSAPTALPIPAPSTLPPTFADTTNPSALPSGSPSFLPSSAPTSLPSYAMSERPSALPSAAPTTLPSAPPSSIPSMLPSGSPSSLPSSSPSFLPSMLPSGLPSSLPSSSPSFLPSMLPSGSPSSLPSSSPSTMPSMLPSGLPSSLPSISPSPMPSMLPSGSPSSLPSSSPSFLPSMLPSANPSGLPSALPSSLPTELPSESPTSLPSSPITPVPSAKPSVLPSNLPSWHPTFSPSTLPSQSPTPLPSSSPTLLPTRVPVPYPTPLPSQTPTTLPTLAPSLVPTFFSPTPVPTTATKEPTHSPTHSPTLSVNFTACAYRFCPKPILGAVQYDKVKVRYSVLLGSRARSRSFNGVVNQYDQSGGISWDDAAEKCARRGMELATIRSGAEQAALVQAVLDRTMFEMETDEFGSEATHVWLGAQRETFRPYWHWMDGSHVWEGNFTNWAEGFAYSNSDVPGDYTWVADDSTKISYLCMSVSDFKWRECGPYTTSVDAFACEDRFLELGDADVGYERLGEMSPKVTSVNPTSGAPGTLLTITGEHLNATNENERKVNASATVMVTIGDEVCELAEPATATRAVCTLPFTSSGVMPVRLSNGLGSAGPGVLPLVTVQHRVHSLTPTVGSLGGGQVLTITGENFPTDPDDLIVSMAVNVSTPNGTVVQTATCNVSEAAELSSALTGTLTSFTCVTSEIYGHDTLTRYTEGTGRMDTTTEGEEYSAAVSVLTRLTGDGDELRLVSQGQYNDFEDHQRPGIYLVTKDSGVEGLVTGGDILQTNFDIRLAAMLYDPFSREVVALCGLTTISSTSAACYSYYSWSNIGDTPTSMISFLLTAPPDYLLIVLTHHWYYHTLNQDLYDALATCGGSDVLSTDYTYYDTRQYMLVGRCNAGLGKGFSSAIGLETKHSIGYYSLEIQFDPFDYFTFEQSAVDANGTVAATLPYVFDEDVTPYVEWISRKNGTTAGGTTVQLVGSGFVPNATTVKLAGVTCALTYEEIGSYRGLHLCEWEGVDCAGLGVSDDGTRITCLTNPWGFDGDPIDAEVTVTSAGVGNALTADTVVWSYANLWSSTTTWGGNDPPVEGDSVVITYGEYIFLDVSPPELVLLTIQGNLEFSRDVGDLALNCSYIVLHYGRLFVGTADQPFIDNKATITLVGNRDSYELPVYGAKTLAVRTAELSLHGQPRTPPWTKLAETVPVGNTTIVLRDDTDWGPGDHIFITSTEYNMLQAEERYVVSASADGRVIELDKPLIYQHWGAGWVSEDGKSSVDGYRASVGLLTRNIVIQGDNVYTKKEQFGAQSVMSTETNTEDNPLIAQFANVEVRNAGQGLKLGKYPIHFHMVGNVSLSYVKNCSVHHTFNRGITIHGVDNLLVEHNVVFDTRGHTIFTEDGTERFNVIRYNLVSVVRPIWSVLLVDQSPACFWIVNPSNDVYGNVAGGSSHYGFWFRALPVPDGISGQATLDAGLSRCPNWAELGDVRDNTGHSTGRHGMKVSNFFPVKGGYFCPSDAVSEPATFKNFTSFKNRHMGIWGEFLVDVSFDGLQLADHVKSGIEFKYMNGRSAKFATTMITNALFVGRMYDEIETPQSEKCAVRSNCQGPVPNGNPVNGIFYPSIKDVGNGWTHALHLPGIGSEVEVHNVTFANYQSAIYGCAWCVAHRGGYEMEFYNVTWQNVEHVVHFKHGVGGILVDGDGSLGTGVVGGTIVPPTGQWRTNSECAEDGTGHYTLCNSPVRRVNVGITQWRSPWWDTNIKKHYPLLIAVDITEEELDEGWDKWNRYVDESRVSCLSATCGLEHYGTPRGAQACFEQAPKSKYSFLAQIGRRYLVTWVDQNFIRTTADVEISVTKMRPDEVMVLQFTHRPPLFPRLPMRASVATGSSELWGELEPRNGAWSPPPNIPIFADELQDHGGDYVADPCSRGVYTTSSYPSSCYNGEFEDTGGFEAPQITEDPSIRALVNGSFASTVIASGRSDAGGQLHPYGGTLKWSGSNVAEDDVTLAQYRAYCLGAEDEPEITGGVKMELRECKTRYGYSDTNLQLFKFGYDWTGDWSTNEAIEAASQARNGKGGPPDLGVWTNALEVDDDGALTSTPVWQQPLTIVLAYNPLYCVDACAPDLSSDECEAAYESGAQVYLNVCDEDGTALSQRFYFDNSTNELVSSGTENAGNKLCVSWSGRIANGRDVTLRDCGRTRVWDESFFVESSVAEPVHGAFYFDAYRNYNTRGVVSPVNVHNLSSSKDLYKKISAPPVAKSYLDYTIWNTSVMSVVVAGNSTLVIETNSCPVEGCDSSVPEDDSRYVFKWSDNETWFIARNGSVPCDHNPTLSHANKLCTHNFPCGCGDVTIWDRWVVTLDVSTPFLNTLTIRGTLIVEHDAQINLAIHANMIDIKGGRFIVGNSSHPFEGPLMQIILHGDMYFHGKECTVPYDEYVSPYGCWKQILVNGELSVQGKTINAVSRTIVADAFAGDQVLSLDSPVDPLEWYSGADLIVSSSDAGGVPEYHNVRNVSADGLEVTLMSPLSSGKIGTNVSLPDGTVLDGRATVSLLSRNIEIRGGYDLDYDYISGVGPDLTDYGATMRLQEAYEEIRDGWDETMVGFDLYGKYYYPEGTITNMNYVRFRAAGKMWDLEPPFREPPIVLHSAVSELSMEGVVVTEPLTGNFFECTRVMAAYKGALSQCNTKGTSKTVKRSIFVGTSVEFAPGSGKIDTVEDNLFFGGFECRTDCPTVKMVTLDSSGGYLIVNNNKAYGGYGGFTLRAPCSTYLSWSDNVAQGNMVGFDVESGCTSLRLEGYRNSAGITAATSSISNFLMVENGMAVTPGKWITWPTVKNNLPPDVNGGGAELAHIFEGTIVGRAPEVGGSVRSSNCQKWSGGGDHPFGKGFKLGGSMTGFRWFTEYGYSGFAANGAYVSLAGTGYNDLKTRAIATDKFSRLGAYGFGGTETAAFHYVLDGINFYGFSGSDSCGRKNVAISNEMAGDGEGTRRAFGAHFGKATCYPIETQNLTFTETPDYARLRFSDGPTMAEVAWGLCTVYDMDKSLMGDSVFIESGIGPYVLKAKKRHEWPAEVLRDCQAWASLGYADDYDGSGTCLWWLRTYDNLRPTIVDATKRGMVDQGARGTEYPTASCDEILNIDTEMADNNVMLCTGLEYVILKSYIPAKVVSGSEVLFGPVGYINGKDAFMGSSSFAGDDTFVDIFRDYTDPRAEQMPPQTGKEPETFSPVDPRYTQTYLATLVNRGFYRIQYTGDITLFDDGFLEYKLVGLTDRPRLGDDDEFAMMIDIKFLKAVNLAFYYDGRQVAAAPRRDRISLDSAAGLSYMDPVSKIVSFVVKGTQNPVRIRQLPVVSVAFGVVVTFDEFFEDNFIDPNAIDAAFENMVPPTYAANYDPDNGNIVKSNTFVRNMASVLNINPSRIRVVNIVPGNRRRLKELAEKEPGKWKHLYHRALEEESDDGLGVDFEISSVDSCADVVCFNGGDCVGDGECACATGFAGPTCNVTMANATASPSNAPSFSPVFNPSPLPTVLPSAVPFPVPSSAPTSTSEPTSGTPRPTLLPSLNPTAVPLPNPTPAPSPLPTPKTDTYTELLNVADTLVAAAAAGTMDTGYEVSEVAVSLPPDVCGVLGGDGTSCQDACGVANGDNSTCADVCGIPYGDGSKCIVVSGGFGECDHGDASTGVLNERQLVIIRGVNVLGTYALTFNGATTGDLSVYSTAETVSAALNGLDTVGVVEVVAVNVTNADSGSGVAAIDIQVEFSRASETFPLHYGSMPSIGVVTTSLTGTVTLTQTDEVCEGTGYTGMTYEEQRITATHSSRANNATFKLNMTTLSTSELGIATGTTPPILPTASAYELSEALAAMTWTGLEDGVTFETTRDYFEVFKADADVAEWVVRWHFLPNSEGLDMTVLGDVQPLVGVPVGSVTVTVVEEVDGVVSADDMPVSAAALAAAQAEEQEEADAAAETAAAEEAAANPVTVTAVQHICGDGILTSQESCDDGGLASGDGCSKNCTVELGFICSDQIGQTSTCSVPVTPTLFFEESTYGPFSEGSNAVVVVRRAGYNGTAVSVDFTVAGSTAVSEQLVNDDCATAGDFNATGGTISFAEGETRKEVEVALYADEVWEQALTQYEKFVVVLSSTATNADVDSTRLSAQVSIKDLDSANKTLGWCLSEAPTEAPTTSPTHSPTPLPSSSPTPLPTDSPTLLPTLTVQPSPLPTPQPTLTFEPTPGTFEPTTLPTTKPTTSPSSLPSPHPSWPPTVPPTTLPSSSPSFLPSALPSALPSTLPTPLPTVPPTLNPTALPSASPTPLPSTTPTSKPTALPSAAPSLVPTPKPSSVPSPEPTFVPTSSPTPLWIGLVVEAKTTTALTGFTSAAEFDADQRTLFKATMVDSIALLTSTDQVTVNNVTLVARRRRRGLLSSTLEVSNTLTIEAEGATELSAVEADVKSQYEAAVTVDSGTGESPFSSAQTAQAAALSITEVATVDSAATISALSSMTTVITLVSTATPSSVPTPLPTLPPSAIPVEPSDGITPSATPASGDDDNDGSSSDGGSAGGWVLGLIVAVGVLLIAAAVVMGHRSRQKSKSKAKVAPEGVQGKGAEVHAAAEGTDQVQNAAKEEKTDDDEGGGGGEAKGDGDNDAPLDKEAERKHQLEVKLDQIIKGDDSVPVPVSALDPVLAEEEEKNGDHAEGAAAAPAETEQEREEREEAEESARIQAEKQALKMEAAALAKKALAKRARKEARRKARAEKAAAKAEAAKLAKSGRLGRGAALPPVMIRHGDAAAAAAPAPLTQPALAAATASAETTTATRVDGIGAPGSERGEAKAGEEEEEEEGGGEEQNVQLQAELSAHGLDVDFGWGSFGEGEEDGAGALEHVEEEGEGPRVVAIAPKGAAAVSPSTPEAGGAAGSGASGGGPSPPFIVEQEEGVRVFWARYTVWSTENHMGPKEVAELLEDRYTHHVTQEKFDTFLNRKVGLAGRHGSELRTKMWAGIVAETGLPPHTDTLDSLIFKRALAHAAEDHTAEDESSL